MVIEFYWIAVAVVIVISSARLTRLATYDKFPPVQYVRNKYADWTDKTDQRRSWQLLAFCAYCASFWITAFVVVWADLAGIFDAEPAFGDSWMAPAWWFFNGSMAASYLAAVFMIHDGEPDSEDRN